jgi:hypothetical protein
MKTSTLMIPAVLILLSMSSFTVDSSISTAAQTIVPSKQTSEFSFFRTHHKGRGVAATWGMITDEDIIEFTVQRTYEDPTDPYANWENLAVIPNNSSRSFTYTDAEVFPGTISYQIVALYADGSTETSEISAVRIRSRR